MYHKSDVNEFNHIQFKTTTRSTKMTRNPLRVTIENRPRGNRYCLDQCLNPSQSLESVLLVTKIGSINI